VAAAREGADLRRWHAAPPDVHHRLSFDCYARNLIAGERYPSREDQAMTEQEMTPGHVQDEQADADQEAAMAERVMQRQEQHREGGTDGGPELQDVKPNSD
jgi:hypothetical protein